MRDRVETERLLLRVPGDGDVSAIVAYYTENRAHLEPWEPARPRRFLTEEFWREQVRVIRADFHAAGAVRFYLFERGAHGHAIGNVSLTQIQPWPAHSCVLGYGLAESAEGRGYMTEAVGAAVAFAFDDLRLHRVMASYMPHNVRSAAVLRRAGFTVEGYACDYLLIAGRWEDHLLTSITNPKWVPAS